MKNLKLQISTDVEEDLSLASPVENGHSSNDSDLKPEAEQVSNEVDTSTRENATFETRADSEKHPQESSENPEATGCSQCEEVKRSVEGIADGHAEDQRPSVQPDHGTIEGQEPECCEGSVYQLWFVPFKMGGGDIGSKSPCKPHLSNYLNIRSILLPLISIKEGAKLVLITFSCLFQQMIKLRKINSLSKRLSVTGKKPEIPLTPP